MLQGGSATTRERGAGAALHGARECGGERFVCRVFDRLAVPADAIREGRPPAASLLAPDGGFDAALCHAYAIEASAGFRDVLWIERIECTMAFAADLGHRRRVLAALAASMLNHDGWLAAHPHAGLWRPGAARHCPRVDVLGQCQALGSAGFLQLCDPSLGAPVPLFAQPWARDRGLLAPVRPPRAPYSRCLAVRRIAPGRMLLFDRKAGVCAATL